MSVRRLADDNVQPASFAFTKENAAWAKATINKYPKGRQQSAVIPLLMRAQEQDGWVTKAAIDAHDGRIVYHRASGGQGACFTAEFTRLVAR